MPKHVATVAFAQDLRLLTPHEREQAAHIISMIAADLLKEDGLDVIKVKVMVLEEGEHYDEIKTVRLAEVRAPQI